MIKCVAAAARAAEPVQDAEWNQVALRHLQSIAASLHFYNSPALSLSAGTGKCCAWSEQPRNEAGQDCCCSKATLTCHEFASVSPLYVHMDLALSRESLNDI
jgi:hypothetical protein